MKPEQRFASHQEHREHRQFKPTDTVGYVFDQLHPKSVEYRKFADAHGRHSKLGKFYHQQEYTHHLSDEELLDRLVAQLPWGELVPTEMDEETRYDIVASGFFQAGRNWTIAEVIEVGALVLGEFLD